MKCLILFSRKNKKKISSVCLSSADSMLCINCWDVYSLHIVLDKKGD